MGKPRRSWWRACLHGKEPARFRQPIDSAVWDGRPHVRLLRDIPFKDLAEDDHGLADETAQFVAADRVEVLFRIHQIDKKVHASLVQPHPSAFPVVSVPTAKPLNECDTRKFRASVPLSTWPGRAASFAFRRTRKENGISSKRFERRA